MLCRAGPQDDNKFDRVPNQWWKPPKLEDKRPYTSPVGWYQKMANLACRPLLVRLSFTRLDNSKVRPLLSPIDVSHDDFMLIKVSCWYFIHFRAVLP